MAQIPQCPFGDEHTWLDVQSHVSRKLRAKFGDLDPEMLHDVLGDVLVDLLGYWTNLPSSKQTDGSFCFDFAITRGSWMGKRKVVEHYRLNEKEHRVYFGLTLDDDDNAEYPDDMMTDPDPTPEEVILALDETERARKMLANLADEDLERYFDLLSGETIRDSARRNGISKSNQGRRVVEARAHLRDSAARYGLVMS